VLVRAVEKRVVLDFTLSPNRRVRRFGTHRGSVSTPHLSKWKRAVKRSRKPRKAAGSRDNKKRVESVNEPGERGKGVLMRGVGKNQSPPEGVKMYHREWVGPNREGRKAQPLRTEVIKTPTGAIAVGQGLLRKHALEGSKP